MRQTGLKLAVAIGSLICLAAAPPVAQPKPGSLLMRGTAATTRSATAPTTSPAERLYAWHVRHMVEAYDRVGSRNPMWDEHARQALATAAQTWGGRHVINADEKTMAAVEQAVAAGCDDALVCYVYARMHVGLRPRSPEIGKLHVAAADALATSDYSPYFKALAHFRAGSYLLGAKTPAGNAAADRRAKAAIAQFVEISRDGELPPSSWFKLTDALQIVYLVLGDDLVAAHEKVDAAIRDLAPETVVLTVKGRFHRRHAWEARGGKYASEVTDEGWKGMRERLVLAQKALEQAWRLDNSNAEAAAAMIDVELGQGQGRQRMELWFRRAMQAEPGHRGACVNKLYYLEPKWYGSPGAMLGFGRECVRTGDWENMMPFVLVDAHESLARYHSGEWKPKPDPAYFRQPAVWKEVSSVFESCLKIYPDAIFHRSRYARFACDAEQWTIAHEQFELLGNFYYPPVFTQERYDVLRREASEKAKQRESGPNDGRL